MLFEHLYKYRISHLQDRRTGRAAGSVPNVIKRCAVDAKLSYILANEAVNGSVDSTLRDSALKEKERLILATLGPPAPTIDAVIPSHTVTMLGIGPLLAPSTSSVDAGPLPLPVSSDAGPTRTPFVPVTPAPSPHLHPASPTKVRSPHTPTTTPPPSKRERTPIAVAEDDQSPASPSHRSSRESSHGDLSSHLDSDREEDRPDESIDNTGGAEEAVIHLDSDSDTIMSVASASASQVCWFLHPCELLYLYMCS